MLKKITQFLGGLSAGPGVGGEPLAQLCLFGKHPGWDDHMQDMGLTTDRLVEVRRLLYSEGIAGNIDSGAWEKLPARVERFDHAFLWRFRRDEFVYGRMWASSDGRGRSKYPMIACVHARGLDPAKISARAAETVTRAMEGCRSERDAQSVRALFMRESEALKAQASAMLSPPDERFDRICRAGMAMDASAHPEHALGLERVAYALHREAEPAIKKESTHISRGVHLRARRMEGLGVGGSAWAWSAASLDLLGRPQGLDEGMLAIEAVEGGWVDLLFGRVSATELFCLKAPLTAVPLTSDVPFSIPAEFADRVRSRVGLWRQNEGGRAG
ncbi:MAG: hypothetical protein U0573_04725 [Phycisphaerales bacterium]|nr:hypothetical protein [Planctomycetota bacterium]